MLCICVCFSTIQFVSFLSETKADRLCKETDVQMDYVEDGLATGGSHLSHIAAKPDSYIAQILKYSKDE